MEHMDEYVNPAGAANIRTLQTLEPHENRSCNNGANEQKLMQLVGDGLMDKNFAKGRKLSD